MRFPEFKDEWEETFLNDCSDYISERINTNKLSEEQYISTENMLQNFYGVENSNNVPNNSNVISFLEQDILISNIRPYLKKIWLANRNGGASTDVLVLRAKKNIEPSFLFYNLANDNFINHVMAGCKGVKMPRGDKHQILTYKLGIPSSSEQSKISDFLSLLDKRIELQKSAIEKLKSLMAGIRKSLFDGCVKNEILGKICSIYQPQTISSTDLVSDGSYPVYGANGIIGRYNKYNHETPQVIVTCRGNTCGTVNFSQPKSWITGNSMVINCDESQSIIDKRYLYHYLCYCDFTSIVSGSGQPQIVRTPLLRFKIYIPTIDKQYQIFRLLDSYLHRIEVDELMLDYYMVQKQYLLSNMFI